MSDAAKKQEEIFQKYNKKLYYIALHITGNKEDAEDALQTTFLNISQNLHKIEDIDSNKTYNYIVTILKNNITDTFRKHARMPHIEYDEVSADKLAQADEYSLDEYIADKIEFQEAVSAVNKLKDEYRIPFLLKYYIGMKETEIAKKLGIPLHLVGIRLYRAKKKIKEIYIQKEGGEKNE